ncbi:MAG TPA: SMP-30/gluconolactonase/LRE family protein [Terriglobales bacterium]|nr:SMP-30/gluconolactonase/LRE family protein [Terriglobales bacterium]
MKNQLKNDWRLTATAALLTIIISLAALRATGQTIQDPPFGRPDAVVDLASRQGVDLVQGQWRYHDVKVVDADSRAVGPDLKPSGAAIRTYDYEPHAGVADFDDSQWEAIDAATLDQRRSTAKVCFNWYRVNVTIPEKVGGFSTAGSTVAFEIVIDDYAEVWVNGRMPRVLGQPGGPVVKGFNAPNRVILTRNAQPGQRIQLAVFGINGPISYSPPNFIWIKSATLDFYKSPKVAISETPAQITKKDPALDEIVPAGAKIEKLAGGFLFTEGPIWVPRTEESDGYLLFSDPNNNVIYRWTQDGQLSIFMTKSGYRGIDIGEYGQPGSNGLTLDKQGRLTINQHGNRRVVRMEKNGQLTVLADHYEGKRLNSPNDLVYKSDWALYFTDPPFGLPKFFDDPRKELPYSGVFRVSPDGKNIQLLTRELSGPNGLAFSPDEKYFYVDNWDEKKKIIMRYEVNADGTLSNGKVFFDMTSAEGEDALDGMKIDKKGNLYVSGPGGLWIISPDGKHLGTIVGPEHPHNFAWGDDDGKTLYLCAKTGLYRIRLNVPGIRP